MIGMGMPISHRIMDRITRTSVACAPRNKEMLARQFRQAAAAASSAVSTSAPRPRWAARNMTAAA